MKRIKDLLQMINLDKLRGVDVVYVDANGDGILSIVPRMFAEVDTQVFPIPITTKLLIDKCGVTGNGFMTETHGVSRFDEGTAIHIIPNPLQRGSWLLCYKDVKIAIDALHELQQAFFVLFREEVEIK